MGKRNKVTTRDIAEYTGVSQSTVSMILSEKKNVSFGEETVQKVKKAAKSLGQVTRISEADKKETGTGPVSVADDHDPVPDDFQRLLQLCHSFHY